ncbi:MAG: hypothetical protein E7627_00460 [Ruminococcaceae bacterium]|nr:hypothetical protein [Oscillospiraceae bacterium]
MKKLLILLLALVVLVSAVACGTTQKDDTNETEPPAQEGTPTGEVNDTTPGETGAVDTGAPETPETEAPVIPPFDYAGNDLTPYIQLGQYMGLEVKIDFTPITDDEFDAEIKAILESYAYTPFIKEDRAAVEGDIISANFSGSINGETIDNTTATDVEISISANSGYIPGFVEGYIGHKVGEVFDFDVKFPDDYHNADLAGVTVTFTGSINGIYDGTEAVAPSLEEFVTDFTDYETVDEFLEDYRGYINDEKFLEAMSAVYDELWQMVLDNATVLDYPENELERVYQLHVATYKARAQQYGVDYETFLAEYVNATPDSLYDSARSYIKEDLVLNQLIKVLEIEITEEAYLEGCQRYADQFGITLAEFNQYYDRETVEMSLLYEEVLAVIAENAEMTE